MNKKIKLFIAEDHPLLRDTIVNALNEFKIFSIVAVPNGIVLLQEIKKEVPDVILLDLEMPEMNGSEAFTIIRKEYPSVKILIFTQYDSEILISNFKVRGADGYISKLGFENIESIVSEIKNVALEGKSATSKDCKKGNYTKKELQIIPLICRGRTTKEIAKELNIGIKGIEKHRINLYKKTGTTNFAELIKHFCKLGFTYLE